MIKIAGRLFNTNDGVYISDSLSEGAFRGSYFVPRQSNQNEGAQPLLTMSPSFGSLSPKKSSFNRLSLHQNAIASSQYYSTI